MKAQYRITEDDYAKAARFHAWRGLIARPSARQLVNAIMAIIIVILLSLAVWTHPGVAVVAAIVPVVLAILSAITLYFGVSNNASRNYRQYKAIQEPLTVELSDDGLRFSAADGESIVPWRMNFQWRQNNQFVLVYKMPTLFHLVPKSLVQPGFDVRLLVQRLAERVGPER